MTTASRKGDLSRAMRREGYPIYSHHGSRVTNFTFSTVSLALITTFCGQLHAQTNLQSRYFYAIENLDTGAIVRRGQTTSAGIPSNGLILAPNTNYREWMLRADAGLIGSVDFRTPSSGFRFTIPKVSLGWPQTPDSDGDGLTDDAEFIVGTDPKKVDTNGNGIKDGAEIALGLDASGSLTGILGSADTPGHPMDICAINDIVIVADSDRGISVFNVFNRMAPLIIAQIDTPGTATAVTCSGNRIAVADGDTGLVVIDISDPPNAQIVFQSAAGGYAQAVAAIGDLVFVGTREGNLVMAELSTGAGLQTLALGSSVQDLAIEGDVIYAYTSDSLKVIPITQGSLKVIGSAASPGGQYAFNGRGRIFVGGGIAYLVNATGYNTFDVSDPAAPKLLLQGSSTQSGWKQIVLNGSGLGIAAVGTNPRNDGSHHVSIYDAKDPSVMGTFVSEFPTPGIARAVCLYNGLAYVADDDNGMHMLGFLGIDTLGKSPSGTLTSSSTNGVVVEGSRVFLRARVNDDVQVRNVEFYVDGVKVATDGNFPFDYGWRVPARSAGTTFAITAIASDTGGNRTVLGPLELTSTPDTNPPTVVIDGPVEGQTFFVGDDLIVKVTALDNVGVATLEFLLDGAVVPAKRISLTDWLLSASPESGKHTITVSGIDFANLRTVSGTRSISFLREAISREVSVFNFGPPDIQDAISREVSAFNFGPADVPDAISREVSIFNFGPLDILDAISREISVFNLGPEDKPEAISRELSVETK